MNWSFFILAFIFPWSINSLNINQADNLTAKIITSKESGLLNIEGKVFNPTNHTYDLDYELMVQRSNKNSGSQSTSSQSGTIQIEAKSSQLTSVVHLNSQKGQRVRIILLIYYDGDLIQEIEKDIEE